LGPFFSLFDVDPFVVILLELGDAFFAKKSVVGGLEVLAVAGLLGPASTFGSSCGSEVLDLASSGGLDVLETGLGL
jgi:hypothetical protein